MINKLKLIPLLVAAPLLLMGTKPCFIIPSTEYSQAEITTLNFGEEDYRGYRTLSITVKNNGDGIIDLRSSSFTIPNHEKTYHLDDIFVDKNYCDSVEYLTSNSECTLDLQSKFDCTFEIEDMKLSFYAINDYVVVDHRNDFVARAGSVTNNGVTKTTFDLKTEPYHMEQDHDDFFLFDVSIKDKTFILWATVTALDGVAKELSASFDTYDIALEESDIVLNRVLGGHANCVYEMPADYFTSNNKTPLGIAMVVMASVALLGGLAIVPFAIINAKKNKKEA